MKEYGHNAVNLFISIYLFLEKAHNFSEPGNKH